MANARLADLFDEIARQLERRGASRHRLRTWRAAAQEIRELDRDLGEMVRDPRHWTDRVTRAS